ncbi:hypothetical protein I656_03648 [Geobacillus sp. WSUCF1]|nr:hypothetical protein I656_03648 [Geobacillus sp. WSUCF1]
MSDFVKRCQKTMDSWSFYDTIKQKQMFLFWQKGVALWQSERHTNITKMPFKC